MARKKKPPEPDPMQPGLFDEPWAYMADAEGHSKQEDDGEPTPATPVWEFAGPEHVDYIGDEPITAFTFKIEELEKLHGIYSYPVLKRLLEALRDLGESGNKRLRERAFTIFSGDAGYGFSLVVVALGSIDGNLVKFMLPYFSPIQGFGGHEAGRSARFMPNFRYDHGYIIEYGDFDDAGTSYVDTDYYGSGLRLYRRACYPLSLWD